MAWCRVLAAALVLGLPIVGTSQPAPLPDQERFFAQVRAKLASNELILSRYARRERSTELSFNPFGRMGTGDVLVHEVYPHPVEELTYRRLIERDGRPVPAAVLAREDAEQQRAWAAWERRASREGPAARAARLRDAAAERAKSEEQARAALDALVFTLAGRDTWQGEPAILITFEPRPGAPLRSREARIAHAFSGRVWVHEYEYEVMRIEATAVDDVSFGFGMIARLHKGLRASFDRRRVGRVWLPSETRFTGTGRALLLRKLAIDFSRTYDSYRPFEPSELAARLADAR